MLWASWESNVTTKAIGVDFKPYPITLLYSTIERDLYVLVVVWTL
jgi:hypothetical protein